MKYISEWISEWIYRNFVLFVGIVLCFPYLYFGIYYSKKETHVDKHFITSENIDTEKFVIIKTYEENIVLLENKQNELFKVKSEVLYYNVTGLELSEITLDTKVYKDVIYYYFKDTRVVLEKI